MEFAEAFTAFEEPYEAILLVVGLAVGLTVFLPRMLEEKPLSLPILLIGVGWLSFTVLEVSPPDPLTMGHWTERLTEFGVIVALMGAGLRLDRAPGWRSWRTTWRLLAITMPLSALAVAALGWWALGLAPAAAALLGAVISPTDPVLAGVVQVGAPGRGSEAPSTPEEADAAGHEDEVRFALTSESGLNDGLAFPYTNLAVAMAIAGAAPSAWFETWMVVDVVYKLGVGLALGLMVGKLAAYVIPAALGDTHLARQLSGMAALATTLGVYALTEVLGGYGFLATFVAAVTLRDRERDPTDYEPLHIFSEQIERLSMTVILVAFGAALSGGLLDALTWEAVGVVAALLLLIRPLSGALGLVGMRDVPWRERWAISFFGVRGIGSLYYLSYALNEADFSHSELIWSTTALLVLVSVIMHGALSSPVINWLDRHREYDPDELPGADEVSARPE